jgi:hypothetical protein
MPRDLAPVAMHLSSMHEVLSPNTSTARKKVKYQNSFKNKQNCGNNPFTPL